MQRIILPKGYYVSEILIFSETEALCLGQDEQGIPYWFYFDPTEEHENEGE